MFERILVPLDGSAFSRAALPAAIALARRVGGEIRVVHVLEGSDGSEEHESLDRIQMHAYLGDVAEMARDLWAIPVSTIVREGEVAEELEAEALGWGADLVVMCTHGRGGLSRLWLGSVADRCVRAGFCPVLLVRPLEAAFTNPTEALRFDRVVVPLDGSELAERALPYATSLARTFDVPATLLRVVTQPAAVEFFHHPDAMQFVHTLRDEDREEAGRYLDGRVSELQRVGIDAQAVVTSESAPAQAIVDRPDGELIVMCTHGRGLVGRSLFGSVADKVVRGGRQPVLLIPGAGLTSVAPTSAASEAS